MKEEELKIAQEEQQDEHCSKGEGNHHNKHKKKHHHNQHHKKKDDESQEGVHSENKDVQNILGSSTSIKVIEVQVFFSYE